MKVREEELSSGEKREKHAESEIKMRQTRKKEKKENTRRIGKTFSIYTRGIVRLFTQGSRLLKQTKKRKKKKAKHD